MEPGQKKIAAVIIVVLILVAIIFIAYIYPTYLFDEGEGGGGGGGPDDTDNKSPVALITTNWTTNIRVGDPIEFNATKSYDEDGEIILYRWDLGDGTRKAGSEFFVINHTYSTPGEKTINLTVQDDDGAQGSAMRTINIRQADFSDTGSALLSAQDVLPIEWPDTATFFFPVEDDVARVNLTLDFLGLSKNQDEAFTSKVDILVKTPSNSTLDNRSVEVLLQAIESFEYLGYQLPQHGGNYMIEVICHTGSVSVSFEVDVLY